LTSSSSKQIAVIGFGLMGSQIAQVFAQSNFPVRAFDISDDQLRSGYEIIQNGKYGLNSLVSKGRLSRSDAETTLSKIALAKSLEDALIGSDLILEAAIEDLDLKQQIFRQIALTAGKDTVFATNTSTLSISSIAKPFSLDIRKRLLGIHFFNPPQIMKLVEIVKTNDTHESVILKVRELADSIHKTPILVQDIPGFVANRIGLSIFAEASFLLENGTSTVRDIDLAMRLGYGYPMGPFELADLVGLDSRLRNMQALYDSTKDERFRPPETLKRLVREGYLGDPVSKKGSKGGYYEYFSQERPARD
jgi:3-hydroxybutyryl-CoA dehydrogenase